MRKRESQATRKNENELMNELMGLKTKGALTEQQEKLLSRLLAQFTEENPAIVAEIIQRWLLEDEI
ncbi:MAG: hypothetical protein MUO76_11535 [Anaerolineaceae bacterium]|nr:hypothetical protein [Anaerolineaceae bacterium]